jgi:hypothetical protein
MDTKITGPYTVRLDEDTFVIDGPTGTFGDFFSKDQADFECARMNGCYAAGQAASLPTLNIGIDHAEAMCGDHGGIEGCSCSLCGSPLGPMELTNFCNGCGAPVDWPLSDGTVVKGSANAHTKAVTVDAIVAECENQVEDDVEGWTSYDWEVFKKQLTARLLKLTQP